MLKWLNRLFSADAPIKRKCRHDYGTLKKAFFSETYWVECTMCGYCYPDRQTELEAYQIWKDDCKKHHVALRANVPPVEQMLPDSHWSKVP